MPARGECGAHAPLSFPVATGLLLDPPPSGTAVLLALAGLLLVGVREGPAALLGTEGVDVWTLPGHLLAVTVSSAFVLPLAVASGGGLPDAMPAAVVWWLCFGLGTGVLRGVADRGPGVVAIRRARWIPPAASVLSLVAALLLALGLWGRPGWAGPAAALLPTALVSLALSLRRVGSGQAGRVRWALTGGNALTLLLLLQGG